MNEILDKFLLAGNEIMLEMHLIQLVFTYSACGPFTKNKERVEKFKETLFNQLFYQNELKKAFLQHDMTYGNFKRFN